MNEYGGINMKSSVDERLFEKKNGALIGNGRATERTIVTLHICQVHSQAPNGINRLVDHNQRARSQLCSMTEQIVRIVLALQILQLLHIRTENIVGFNVSSYIIRQLQVLSLFFSFTRRLVATYQHNSHTAPPLRPPTSPPQSHSPSSTSPSKTREPRRRDSNQTT